MFLWQEEVCGCDQLPQESALSSALRVEDVLQLRFVESWVTFGLITDRNLVGNNRQKNDRFSEYYSTHSNILNYVSIDAYVTAVTYKLIKKLA